MNGGAHHDNTKTGADESVAERQVRYIRSWLQDTATFSPGIQRRRAEDALRHLDSMEELRFLDSGRQGGRDLAGVLDQRCLARLRDDLRFADGMSGDGPALVQPDDLRAAIEALAGRSVAPAVVLRLAREHAVSLEAYGELPPDDADDLTQLTAWLQATEQESVSRAGPDSRAIETARSKLQTVLAHVDYLSQQSLEGGGYEVYLSWQEIEALISASATEEKSVGQGSGE